MAHRGLLPFRRAKRRPEGVSPTPQPGRLHFRVPLGSPQLRGSHDFPRGAESTRGHGNATREHAHVPSHARPRGVARNHGQSTIEATVPGNSRGAQGARRFLFPSECGTAELTALDAWPLVKPPRRAPAGSASGQSPLRRDCLAAVLAQARGHPAPMVGRAALSQVRKLEVSEAPGALSKATARTLASQHPGHRRDAPCGSPPALPPPPVPRPRHDGTGPGGLRALLGLRPELPHTPACNLGSKGGVP